MTSVHTDVQLLNKVSHSIKLFIFSVAGKILLGKKNLIYNFSHSVVFLLGFAEEFQDVDRPRLCEPVHPVMLCPLW